MERIKNRNYYLVAAHENVVKLFGFSDNFINIRKRRHVAMTGRNIFVLYNMLAK